MVEYKCNICNKIFKKKTDHTRHINRKISCKSNKVNKTQINAKTMQNNANMENNNPKTMQNNADIKCSYCNKIFKYKNNLYTHINKRCKIRKNIENEKQTIFNNLVIEMNELKEKITKQEQEIMILKEDKQKIITGNTNSNNKNNNNSNNSNNNINSNNTNHIQLIAFGKETLDKITKEDILDALKKGFQSTVELTKKMHFNPNIPENHNVYTPSLKDNHSMIFDGTKWSAKPTETVIDELYDNKKAILIEYVEELNPKLNDTQQRSIERWCGTTDDHKRITNVKKESKLLLHNERNIPINIKNLIKSKTKEITFVS
jgi:uncharacterized C2H2 Zn-finger protein